MLVVVVVGGGAVVEVVDGGGRLVVVVGGGGRLVVVVGGGGALVVVVAGGTVVVVLNFRAAVSNQSVVVAELAVPSVQSRPSVRQRVRTRPDGGRGLHFRRSVLVWSTVAPSGVRTLAV
jgi:hypothetical protein